MRFEGAMVCATVKCLSMACNVSTEQETQIEIVHYTSLKSRKQINGVYFSREIIAFICSEQ